jgi:ketosteroid isomerase-like protein
MTEAHDLIRRFFAEMPKGKLDPGLFTEDLSVTTASSPEPVTGAFYLGGIEVLQSLFPDGLHYTVDAVIVEGDRAAAEVRSRGTMADGEVFATRYAFLFTLRDGKIAKIAEFFEPEPVQRLIMPKLIAAMGLAQN